MQQQQNIIKNPKPAGEPKVKGPELNDRDRINAVLATEKYLIDSLNTFAKEASHQKLHDDIMQILIETHQCARKVFNTMFKNGWYSLEVAEQQTVQKTQQQFSNYRSQFPYKQIH